MNKTILNRHLAGLCCRQFQALPTSEISGIIGAAGLDGSRITALMCGTCGVRRDYLGAGVWLDLKWQQTDYGYEIVAVVN